VEKIIMQEVNQRIDAIEAERAEEARRNREREERRRRDLLALRGVKFCRFISHQPRRLGRKKRRKTEQAICTRSKFQLSKAKDRVVYRRTAAEKSFVALPRRAAQAVWRGLQCRFCSLRFNYTKGFFQHVRNVHIAPIRRRVRHKLEIRPGERRRLLTKLYPPITARSLDPKKKYVCAVCKSVCDLYGLFLHMKEVHHGLLCQYCLKLFKKVRENATCLTGT
jgi:hypothetical protein